MPTGGEGGTLEEDGINTVANLAGASGGADGAASEGEANAPLVGVDAPAAMSGNDVGADHGAASGSSVTLPGTASTERADSRENAGAGGSKQTNLSHWLL